MCQFLWGPDKIKKIIGDHGILADLWAQEIVKPQAKKRYDMENVREIHVNQHNLEGGNEALTDLKASCNEVAKLSELCSDAISAYPSLVLIHMFPFHSHTLLHSTSLMFSTLDYSPFILVFTL